MHWSPIFSELARQSWYGGLDDQVRSVYGPLVAGVDEVGRGCLAGPVAVAAVILPAQTPLPGIDDSKQLTAKRRETLAEMIREHAIAWKVEFRSSARIDSINILQATREAASAAVVGLRLQPDAVITDALDLDRVTMPVVPVVRGDSLSMSVAAASVLAKVERDACMTDLDRDFPHYRFGEHKGYASPMHRDALCRFGPCPAHRLTFASVVPRTG